MKNFKYLLILVAVFSFAACTGEKADDNSTVTDYSDLSVCGEFAAYEVATDSGYYSVARSTESGECLFILNGQDDNNEGECAFDESIHMVNPNVDCITFYQKFYNLQGEEIEEVTVAASKTISQEDYNMAIGK